MDAWSRFLNQTRSNQRLVESRRWHGNLLPQIHRRWRKLTQQLLWLQRWFRWLWYFHQHALVITWSKNKSQTCQHLRIRKRREESKEAEEKWPSMFQRDHRWSFALLTDQNWVWGETVDCDSVRPRHCTVCSLLQPIDWSWIRRCLRSCRKQWKSITSDQWNPITQVVQPHNHGN